MYFILHISILTPLLNSILTIIFTAQIYEGLACLNFDSPIFEGFFLGGVTKVRQRFIISPLQVALLFWPHLVHMDLIRHRHLQLAVASSSASSCMTAPILLQPLIVSSSAPFAASILVTLPVALLVVLEFVRHHWPAVMVVLSPYLLFIINLIIT